MTTPDAVRQPDASSGRILGYDLARGLAILGMVLVNFRIVMAGDRHDPGWLAWLVGQLEGRASALFVVLAGVGISLLTRRARTAGDAVALRAVRGTLLKRAGFLFIAGFLFATLWPGDILHFYGVFFAVGALLCAVSDRWLWSWAAGFAGSFVLLCLLFDYSAGWEWESLTYRDFWTPAGVVRHLFFNGFHPVVPWTAFLLVGLWLGRRDLRDRGQRRRMLWKGVGAVAGAELISWLCAPPQPPADSSRLTDFLFGTASMPPMPLYLVAAGGAAVAVIALCVGLGERGAGRGWLFPLTATGQLALTFYFAHVVLGLGTLEALGRLEHQSLPFAAASAVACFGVAVAFATLWRRRFARGPLEWLMRRVAG